MNAQEWQIREPATACAACGGAFADGAGIVSRLAFEPPEGYRRDDCCARCWTDARREGAVSVWRGAYRAPAPPPPEPLRKETAESLLRRFMEGDDPARRDAIFVLAVMLERKRLLVERAVTFEPDGRKVRAYEHRGTGETFVVTDPQLRLSDLERVQREVVVLLGGRLPGAPAPAAPDATAEPAAAPAEGADAGPQA
jgi:hypothetical protein